MVFTMTIELKQFEVGWTCPKCGMIRGEDKVDPCLGMLPGVIFACCGHGNNGYCGGYIYFENGVIIRFDKLTVERA